MPNEVGVLELQIRDNAEQSGTGLRNLADALTRVRTAVGTDKLGLSNVGTELNKLARQINGAQSNTPTIVKNITALMNSLTGFSKIKDLTINTDTLDKLTGIINSGINIGTTGSQMKALQTALSGSWDAEPAKTAMETVAGAAKTLIENDTAGQLKTITESLNKFSKAYNSLPKITTKTGKNIMQQLLDNVVTPLSTNVANEIKKINPAKELEDYFERINENNPFNGKYISRNVLNLQQFGGKGSGRRKGQVNGQTEMDLSSIAETASQSFETVENKIEAATESAKKFNIQLVETKDLIQSIIVEDADGGGTSTVADTLGSINNYMKNGATLADRFAMSLGNLSTGLAIIPYTGESVLNTAMQEAKKLEEIANFSRSVAPENMLSTWINPDTKWKPNWTMVNEEEWKPDWISDPSQGTQVFSSIRSAAKSLGISVDEVKEKLNATLQTLSDSKFSVEGGRIFVTIEEAARSLGMTVDEVRAKLDETMQMLGNAGTSQMDTAPDFTSVRNEIMDVKTEMDSLTDTSYNDSIIPIDLFIETYSHLDYLKAKLIDLKSELDIKRQFFSDSTADDIDKNVMQIIRLQNEIRALEEEEGKASQSTFNLSNTFNALKSGIQKMFPTLTGMIKRFSQIAKYRALRAVLKHITAGFTEGVENVYHYSKIVGTSLAPAMDAAATSFQQLKNSVGAAVAPLIQAFIPVIQQVVSVVIEGINYLNQFFALLNGQKTWTRALPEAAEAYNNTAKNAKSASKATKDLLASWDELNIISSKDTGSAGTIGGHTANEYKDMFEEVSKYDSKVKDTFDFLKDNIDYVKGTAISIGKTILGWKLSKGFKGLLGKIGTVSAAGGIIELTWEVTNIVDHAYLKDGQPGWLVADALTNLVGDFMAGRMIASVLGSGTGAITMGLAMGVSAGITYGIALANNDNENSKSLQTLGLVKLAIADLIASLGFVATTGSLAAGLALGTATVVPLFTATAFIAYVAETDKNAHEVAKEAFEKGSAGGIDVEELYKEIQKEFDKASSKYTLVINAFSNVPQLNMELKEAMNQIDALNNVVRGNGALTQDEAEAFKKAWETALSAFSGITEASFKTALETLNTSLSSANEEIRKQARELRVSTLMMQKNITEAEAQFIDDMNELQEKVATGKAKPEEFEKYEEYVEQMALASDVIMSNMDHMIDTAQKVDVSDTGKISEYIVKLNEESQAALQQIEEGLTSGLDTWNVIKKRNEMYHNLGYITDEVYNEQKVLIDAAIDNITKNAEENKKIVEEKKQQAFETIFGSALEGLKLLPINENTNAPAIREVAAYFYDYIKPFVEAIEAAGGTVPEEIKKAVKDATTINTNLIYGKGQKGRVENAKDELREYVKKLLGLDETAIDVEANIEVDPNIINENEIKQTVQEAIENGFVNLEPVKKEIQTALSDGFMDSSERYDLLQKWGQTLFDAAMEELNINLDEEGYSLGKLPRSYGMIASAGGLPTLPSASSTGTTGDIAMNETSLANGVRQGNSALVDSTNDGNDLMRTMVGLLRIIANNSNNRNDSPTSSDGFWSEQANRMRELVQGNFG